MCVLAKIEDDNDGCDIPDTHDNHIRDDTIVHDSHAVHTGCPTILFPLCFWLFLSFLIRYRNGFIVLSTALSMLIIKHIFILFLDEILGRIFAK